MRWENPLSNMDLWRLRTMEWMQRPWKGDMPNLVLFAMEESTKNSI